MSGPAWGRRCARGKSSRAGGCVRGALQCSGDPLGGGWVELPPGGEPFGGGELDSLDLDRVSGGLEDDAAAAAWRPGEPATVGEVATRLRTTSGPEAHP